MHGLLLEVSQHVWLRSQHSHLYRGRVQQVEVTTAGSPGDLLSQDQGGLSWMQSTVSFETQVLWVPAQISNSLPSPGRSPELGWG